IYRQLTETHSPRCVGVPLISYRCRWLVLHYEVNLQCKKSSLRTTILDGWKKSPDRTRCIKRPPKATPLQSFVWQRRMKPTPRSAAISFRKSTSHCGAALHFSMSAARYERGFTGSHITLLRPTSFDVGRGIQYSLTLTSLRSRPMNASMNTWTNNWRWIDS